MSTGGVPTPGVGQRVSAEETDKYLTLKWLINLLLPALILLIPTSETFTPDIKVFFAITAWAVLCWLMGTLPETLVALILPVFYIMAKVAEANNVFSPWSTTIPWVVIGGMIFGAVLIGTGLAKRIAYWTILKMGATYMGTLVGLTLAGIILAPFIPTAMGKMAILAPIAIGICQALDLPAKSRAASAVMMTAFLAVTNPAFSYLTGGSHIIMATGLVGQVTGNTIAWSEYALHNWFIFTIWSFISLAIVLVVLRPEKELQAKELIKQRYQELGPISTDEKKVACLMILILMALFTDKVHKLDAAWVFMIIAVICFLPKVNLMNNEKLRKINWGMIFFISGTMAIGSAAVASGAGKWLASVLFPYLTGGEMYTLFAVWFFGVAINFVLTPLAATASFTVPIAEMAISSGINPVPVVYALLQGLDQYVFPYEYALLMFIYGFGYISLKNMIKVLIPRIILSAVFLVVIAYPYWKLVGLFN